MANKRLTSEQKQKRLLVSEDVRSRMKKIRIKYRTVAELIGIALPHFHQMLTGQRPIEDHIYIIETVLTEYEEAERRIRERLFV